MSPKVYAREFYDFLFKTNVFALALGVVIGTAVSKLVEAVVGGLFMPVVGILTTYGDYKKFTLSLGSRIHFEIGKVMGAVVDFVIIAVIVFILTKLFLRQQAPPPAPPTKPCSRCKEPIHVDATRCKFCTSEV